MKIHHFGLIPALLLLGSLAFAQEAAAEAGESVPPGLTRLSPDQAVEMAIKNNLGLRRTTVENEAKRRSASTPWNVLIPTIDVSTTLAHPHKPAASIPGLDIPRWNLGAQFQASVSVNIGTFVKMKQTIDEYHAGRIGVEKAKLALERDVRKACFDLLLARGRIALLRESYANAERRAASAQANYRAGLIPEVSMLQAQVARDNMRPTLDEAENGYKALMARFALYLGLPYNSQFELEEQAGAEFIPLDTEELIAKAAANKPDIEELRRSLAALKARRTSTFFSIYTPSLQLAYTRAPLFNGDPLKDPVLDFDRWKESTGAFSITLLWRLNGLLPFTAEYQGYRELDDMVKALNLGLAQAVQGAETETYNIILTLEKTRASVEAQKNTVALAERTLLLSEVAYRNGLKEFLDVQNDQLALNQARLESLNQNYNYLKDLLDLEYAIGVPFGSLGGRN
ncbi:MAG: TolC family protein [Treponema sp.]|jgi:outer membrane protein TolC|nr:TolC family protein [Treponema sp.]